jgi:hypothetical protein
MDTINNLITSIAQISFNNLPVEEGWGKYEIKVFSLRRMIEINASYTENGGQIKSFDPSYQGEVDRDQDLTFLFMDLRKAMYDLSPEKGAWFTCEITVFSDDKFETKFNYDDKPNFSYEPTDDKYADDLKTFPREANLVPDWLREKIGRVG